MELDTLGEDWLLALQDELTKPYFLKVRPRPFCPGFTESMGLMISVEGVFGERKEIYEGVSAR